MAKRPNIVIINPDHYRGDVLGHVGNPAAVTANLDKTVATDGVSFNHTFCQAGVSVPSRCSFMSGWYPHVRGHRTMFHMMRRDEPVLLKTLKDAGYFVWWGGKNDLVPGQHPADGYYDVRYDGWKDAKRQYGAKDRQGQCRGEPGSDTYYSFCVGRLETDGQPYYPDGNWTEVHKAVEFIKQGPARPFRLFLALGEPDTPYAVEDPWYSMIDRRCRRGSMIRTGTPISRAFSSGWPSGTAWGASQRVGGVTFKVESPRPRGPKSEEPKMRRRAISKKHGLPLTSSRQTVEPRRR